MGRFELDAKSMQEYQIAASVFKGITRLIFQTASRKDNLLYGGKIDIDETLDLCSRENADGSDVSSTITRLGGVHYRYESTLTLPQIAHEPRTTLVTMINCTPHFYDAFTFERRAGKEDTPDQWTRIKFKSTEEATAFVAGLTNF